MANLLKPKTPKPKPVEAPKVEVPEVAAPTRMPTASSASVQEQGRLAREKALRRRGRLSTILTDMNTTGSSGKTLGA